jgi:predicted transcriptional regulator
MGSTMLSLRVPDELARRLDKTAKAMGRSKAFVMTEALKTYLELESWQVGEIKRAVQDADAGAFAGDVDVSATLAKWSGDAG